ncbi:MAG: GMC family oxidoreductase [Deltaproteobacteria bacterium]|nr:GMC family oxidoreductase [Deltaproteobacteria bacterium]
MEILDGAAVREDFDCEADVIVVGTGAGGAVVAAKLAEAGARVLVLEEGGYFRTRDFSGRALEMINRLYRDKGVTTTLGNTMIALPMGCCVGGTTTVNSGSCYPAPDYVLEAWSREEGLEACRPEALGPWFEEIRRRISVTPVPEELLGPNAGLFREGVRKLGWKADPIPRNVKACRGTGVCAFGCPTAAKQSMNVSYVPAALAAGARLMTRARVKRIVLERRRVRGVEAEWLDEAGRPRGLRLRASAPKVVVACGAIYTPALLSGSGVRHPMLGRNLRIHPAARIGALFEKRVRGWIGVPQSYHISQFEREGIFIQGQFVPPGVEAPVLPGIGPSYRRLMEQYPFLGSFGALISERGVGRVFSGPRGKPIVYYNLSKVDRRLMLRSISLTAEAWFAAGAKEVFTSLRHRPILRNLEEARALPERDIKAKYFELMAFHPMGTVRMSADPRRGVTDGSGRVFDYEGLYVADASLLPTSTRRNPMMTIMALATLVAHGLAARG